MLEWEKLLNPNRRKGKAGTKNVISTSAGRIAAERDHDRILFATPTRRMADKTQVFPLDPNDSVRTRLTHSHEVSNLARSIGIKLAFEYPEQVFGINHDKLNVKRSIPAMLAAIGLAHDLGNPPFGHQGEVAIMAWFKKTHASENNVHQDFLQFDGNPQTFRLLTRLQILNDDFGLNLSYGTLAALIKYPSHNQSTVIGGYKKFGIFKSEQEIADEVWQETGLAEGIRHPLTHIMEACDDMAYAVMDAEDTVKKGYASFYDLIDHLNSIDDPVTKEVVRKAIEKNKEFRKEELSSGELNDISMQMFRVFALHQMVEAVTETFVSKIDQILDNDISGGFELMKNCKAKQLCSKLKSFDRRHGFDNKNVLRLELHGNKHILKVMDMLWAAINNEDLLFSRYANAQISENYRRVYKRSNMDPYYKKHQLLGDTLSGMTDQYLLNIHADLIELYK